VVGAVVAAAAVAAIVVPAIVPAVALTLKAVVPPVMSHLMLTLLVVGRIIAAAACLSNGRYRDGAGGGQHGQSLRVAGMHVGFLSWIAM
jgi:hypothetical protein